MTKTNIDFCNATAVWNSGNFADEIAWVCEPDEVIETRETIVNYETERGKPHDIIETPVGELFIWNNQQSRKGMRRGDLFLMDAGDHRLVYFSGEF